MYPIPIRAGDKLGVDQGTPHDVRDAVDQRVMNHAIRDVHDAVRAQLEQAELGRAQPAANSQARAVPKCRTLSGNYRHIRQTVSFRQLRERACGGRRDAMLGKAWTAGTRRTVWANEWFQENECLA